MVDGDQARKNHRLIRVLIPILNTIGFGKILLLALGLYAPIQELFGTSPVVRADHSPFVQKAPEPGEPVIMSFAETERLTIPLDIGDCKGIRMLVDTGASLSILDKKVAVRCSSGIFKYRTPMRAGGQRPGVSHMLREYTEIREVRFGSIRVPDVSVPVGGIRKSDRQWLGIIGQDFIRNWKFVVDGPNRRVGILASGTVVPPLFHDHVDGDWWRTNFIWGSGLPFLEVSMAGWSGPLLIDSGATMSGFPRALIEALSGVEVRTEELSDVVGMYKVRIWRIPEFSLGPFVFRDKEVIERDASFALIGNDTLGSGMLALDGPRQELLLKLPSER